MSSACICWARKCGRVTSGSRTLKDAMNEALRDWVANVDDTFYIIGSAAGPHPYPAMVRDFQTVIGNETRAQMLEQEEQAARSGGGLRRRRLQRHRHVPSFCRRCAMSKFTASKRRARAWTRRAMPPPSPKARPACCMARAPICCRTRDGQILEAHSISAGLDYPGVGPEHSWLKDIGRVKYFSATDQEALDAFSFFPSSKASSRRWNPRMPSPMSPRVAPQDAQGPDPSPSACRAAATRMCSRSPTRWEKRLVSRIAARFADLESATGRAAFVPFITAGDPDFETSLRDSGSAAGCGRRSDRAGHALLRSHGRRPGGAGLQPAGAESRRDHDRTCWIWCENSARPTTRRRSC